MISARVLHLLHGPHDCQVPRQFSVIGSGTKHRLLPLGRAVDALDCAVNVFVRRSSTTRRTRRTAVIVRGDRQAPDSAACHRSFGGAHRGPSVSLDVCRLVMQLNTILAFTTSLLRCFCARAHLVLDIPLAAVPPAHDLLEAFCLGPLDNSRRCLACLRRRRGLGVAPRQPVA